MLLELFFIIFVFLLVFVHIHYFHWIHIVWKCLLGPDKLLNVLELQPKSVTMVNGCFAPKRDIHMLYL